MCHAPSVRTQPPTCAKAANPTTGSVNGTTARTPPLVNRICTWYRIAAKTSSACTVHLPKRAARAHHLGKASSQALSLRSATEIRYHAVARLRCASRLDHGARRNTQDGNGSPSIVNCDTRHISKMVRHPTNIRSPQFVLEFHVLGHSLTKPLDGGRALPLP